LSTGRYIFYELMNHGSAAVKIARLEHAFMSSPPGYAGSGGSYAPGLAARVVLGSIGERSDYPLSPGDRVEVRGFLGNYRFVSSIAIRVEYSDERSSVLGVYGLTKSGESPRRRN
jgi:hypothetical protein